VEIQDKIRTLLEESGIGTDPDVILAFGYDGLTAVKGIGPATANDLLEAARAAVEAPAGDEDEFVEAEAHAPLEAYEPEPIMPTMPIQVRLIGRASAVVDHAVLYEGGVRTVTYAAYEQAAANYPEGTFETRLPGGSWE